MNLGFGFFVKNTMLGVGLAMDAFSVSLANGLHEPCMSKKKMCAIAGVFACFQALMPMLGWLCVHTVVQYFSAFEKLIPWIALGLLSFIGGKMLKEGIQNKDECDCAQSGVGLGALLLQGIATSIDALSVGFAIAEYNVFSAIVAALVIAVVTFVLCLVGVFIGKKAGTALSGKAGIFGGIILIIIGWEIFLTNIF